jgi:RNA polymerase sigma-70 factor (ECF subfamily)
MEICGGPVYPRLFSAHSACADMYRRLGGTAEARASYEKALALTQQEPERQFPQGSLGRRYRY